MEYQYSISRSTFDDEIVKSDEMRSRLLELGLSLIDITDDEYNDSLLYMERYPKLSVYDALALSIAKRRAWVLLTGDKPLRKAAEQEQVECHGTLWVYDQLKEQGKMKPTEIRAAIVDLIKAVETGRCRFPMAELQKRLE